MQHQDEKQLPILKGETCNPLTYHQLYFSSPVMNRYKALLQATGFRCYLMMALKSANYNTKAHHGTSLAEWL